MLLAMIYDLHIRLYMVIKIKGYSSLIVDRLFSIQNDPRQSRRSEDSIIAYTWINWIRTPEEERDPDTMVLFAMTKVKTYHCIIGLDITHIQGGAS